MTTSNCIPCRIFPSRLDYLLEPETLWIRISFSTSYIIWTVSKGAWMVFVGFLSPSSSLCGMVSENLFKIIQNLMLMHKLMRIHSVFFTHDYLTCLQTRRSPATLMFVNEHFLLNAARASVRAVSFFMACCACNGKASFTLSENEGKSELSFDLCRCLMWTFNWIFCKPIWKRCHFHFRFRTEINES